MNRELPNLASKFALGTGIFVFVLFFIGVGTMIDTIIMIENLPEPETEEEIKFLASVTIFKLYSIIMILIFVILMLPFWLVLIQPYINEKKRITFSIEPNET